MNGTDVVYCNTEFRGVKLGAWCSDQRARYHKGTLSADRIDKLNQIGFAWDRPPRYRRNVSQKAKKGIKQQDVNNKAWNQKFELLKQYRDEFDTCKIKLGETYKGVKLGQWWNQQKYRYHHGMMPKERAKKLEEEGFV